MIDWLIRVPKSNRIRTDRNHPDLLMQPKPCVPTARQRLPAAHQGRRRSQTEVERFLPRLRFRAKELDRQADSGFACQFEYGVNDLSRQSKIARLKLFKQCSNALYVLMLPGRNQNAGKAGKRESVRARVSAAPARSSMITRQGSARPIAKQCVLASPAPKSGKTLASQGASTTTIHPARMASANSRAPGRSPPVSTSSRTLSVIVT